MAMIAQSRGSSGRGRLTTTQALVVGFALMTSSAFLVGLSPNPYELYDAILPSAAETEPATLPCVKKELLSVREMEAISERLLGPDAYGKGCPPGCGCPKTPVDCPRHYTFEDVETSAVATYSTSVSLYFENQNERRHAGTLSRCITTDGKLAGDTGGWCLGNRNNKNIPNLSLPDGRQIGVPSGHVPPSQVISETLKTVFVNENVTSVTDFGAGVGQYGVYLKTHIPDIVYRGYDGAGDIEPYTSGFVRYLDLTLPLALPVSDWVISFEVGEHIPSKFEGMFVRNIHRHNCKGVILSWAVMSQKGGFQHINLHTNEYVAEVFDNLGYERDFSLEAKFRNTEKRYGWFRKSLMVFRRRYPTCGNA